MLVCTRVTRVFELAPFASDGLRILSRFACLCFCYEKDELSKSCPRSPRRGEEALNRQLRVLFRLVRETNNIKKKRKKIKKKHEHDSISAAIHTDHSG